MPIERQATLPAKPRWNGSRMLFTIDVEGHEIPCAISRDALQALGDGRFLRDADLLRRFAQHRARIAEIALAIVNARPDSISGVISIWADDINDPPTAPAVARQAAQHGPA